MSHTVEFHDSHVEVRLKGRLDRWDILDIVHRLHESDPRKERCDLWVFEQDCEIIADGLATTVESFRHLCSKSMLGARSALVVSDPTQRKIVEAGQSSARLLPYEVSVFGDRKKALAWLGAGPRAPSAKSEANG